MTMIGKLFTVVSAACALGCGGTGSGAGNKGGSGGGPSAGAGGAALSGIDGAPSAAVDATALAGSGGTGSDGAVLPGAGGAGIDGTVLPGAGGAGIDGAVLPGAGGAGLSGVDGAPWAGAGGNPQPTTSLDASIATDDPGGTWVVPSEGGTTKPGKGTGGAGGSAGIDGSAGATCEPGVVGAIVTGCGYPYASDNALTSVDFNESEVLRAIRPSIADSGGIVSLLYNDEHAMTLGVRQVVIKSASGTTTTDYPVSPLPASPSSIFNPQTGTNELAGDTSGLDPSLRPLWPVLYVTDITKNPASRAGDWQMGGRPLNPDAVFGTWKAAVRTVDNTTTPPTTSVTADADPAKNNWNLIVNDPVPTGIKDEGWSAEVRWGVKFQPGHSYRLQVIVHDGDQNKVGGDCGEACVVFCAGGSTTTPPTCTDPTQVCGEGMGEGGGYASCGEGASCLDGCCTTLTCPVDVESCGQIGAEGEILGCNTGFSCVSGCCIASPVIP